MSPRGMLGWRHAFAGTVPMANHAFADAGAFTIAGAPITKDAALIEAGLDFDIAPSATLSDLERPDHRHRPR